MTAFLIEERKHEFVRLIQKLTTHPKELFLNQTQFLLLDHYPVE